MELRIPRELGIAMPRTSTDRTSSRGACGRTRYFWSGFWISGPKDTSRIDDNSQVPMKTNSYCISLNVSSKKKYVLFVDGHNDEPLIKNILIPGPSLNGVISWPAIRCGFIPLICVRIGSNFFIKLPYPFDLFDSLP